MSWMQSDLRDGQAKRGGQAAVGGALHGRVSPPLQDVRRCGTACVCTDDERAFVRGPLVPAGRAV